jgi:hypothetical protein
MLTAPTTSQHRRLILAECQIPLVLARLWYADTWACVAFAPVERVFLFPWAIRALLVGELLASVQFYKLASVQCRGDTRHSANLQS